MLQILLLTFKPAVESATSLLQQLNGLRLLGLYLLLFDLTGAHPNSSSSHKYVSCIISLAPVESVSKHNLD